jgi:hypothetical protein
MHSMMFCLLVDFEFSLLIGLLVDIPKLCYSFAMFACVLLSVQ